MAVRGTCSSGEEEEHDRFWDFYFFRDSGSQKNAGISPWEHDWERRGSGENNWVLAKLIKWRQAARAGSVLGKRDAEGMWPFISTPTVLPRKYISVSAVLLHFSKVALLKCRTSASSEQCPDCPGVSQLHPDSKPSSTDTSPLHGAVLLCWNSAAHIISISHRIISVCPQALDSSALTPAAVLFS